ncbi:hypothetical protein N752_26915 [Desulforamulus aquiferis]|nr:hypothetical protein [Desulforamulus aquiferis]RYD02085.1 hypothetical protein N752_26915 [Desulforamulus aquiferis]
MIGPGGDNIPLPGIKFNNTKIERVSVIAVSIGEAIENKVQEAFKQGNFTTAIILDSVGNIAVQEVADWIVNLLSKQYRSKGLFPTPRYIPGCKENELAYLPLLMELAGAGNLNINCTPYYQLEPVKSLVFWVGWGPNRSIIQVKCMSCQKENCIYRVRIMEGEG